MARIDSYTAITPTVDDYLLGTDSPAGGGPTRNFTVQSIIDLVDTEASGNTNDYLDGITVESGYAADSSDTATITFSVGSQTDATLNLGGAAFKAANHYAVAADLSDHIGDTTQPHSLDSIVGSGTITATKLSGNPGNGTSGQVLLSDGAGGFSWGADSDANDNYYLSAIAKSGANVVFTVTGGSNITTDIFKEGAFLSKSDIRTDIKNNNSFVKTDFSFLGTLSTKDKITAADINENAISASKIQNGVIGEDKLNISNAPVDGYVLTADGTDGVMEWVANSASNYYLNDITRGGTNNRTLTFVINGGTNVPYTFGDGAFANYGTGANDVARGNHSHVITDIADRGSLSELNTVGTSEITNNAVTAAKLQPSTVGSDGQVLSVDGSGDLQWINSSAQSIASLRLLPTTIGTAKQVLRVNTGATAVEYSNLSVAKTELNTTNSPAAGKILAIDQNGDMLWAEEGQVTLSANSISSGMIQNDNVTPEKISVFEDNMTSTTAGHVLVSNGTEFDNVALSGDVFSVSGSGVVSLNLDNLGTAPGLGSGQDFGQGDDEIVVVDKNMLSFGISRSKTYSISSFLSNIAGTGLTSYTKNVGLGGGQSASYAGLKIAEGGVDYLQLSDSFKTRDSNVTLASGSATKDIDFDQKAIYEVTLPIGDVDVTLNFDGSQIGMTKVVVLKTQSSAYTGDITLTQTSGTGTFVRLSSDDIVKDASTTNYIQITCIDKSGTNRTYIYTVGQAQ